MLVCMYSVYTVMCQFMFVLYAHGTQFQYVSTVCMQYCPCQHLATWVQAKQTLYIHLHCAHSTVASLVIGSLSWQTDFSVSTQVSFSSGETLNLSILLGMNLTVLQLMSALYSHYYRSL